MEAWVGKMVEVARQARLDGVSMVQLAETALQMKVQNTSFLNYHAHCVNGQLAKKQLDKVFEELNSLLDHNHSENLTIGDKEPEDLKTGLMIFYRIVYCNSKQMKLFKFVHLLAQSESERTVLRSLITTIEAGKMKGIVDDEKITSFNKVVNQIFDLQYGKILLATTPRDLLKDMHIWRSMNTYGSMVDRNPPLFADDMDNLKLCLNSTNSPSVSNNSTNSGCQEVRRLVETLGRSLVTSHTHSL